MNVVLFTFQTVSLREVTVCAVCLFIVCTNNSFLLTHSLTPWSTVLLEKLTGSAASQEIPCIFGT